jgi:DNA repair exonuclease SbcCD ATPase subunit
MLTTPLRQSLNQKLAELSLIKAQIQVERKGLLEAKAKSQDLKQALSVAQAVAQTVQQEAHRKIADVVSKSLDAVFDDQLEFKIKFEQKRGRTEAQLLLYKNGIELGDPMDSTGGGVLDLCSFALRLSAICLTRPPVRKLLVCDEPFKHLSAEFRPRVRELILRLAKELDFQIIFVTHSTELACGKVIEL